MLGTTEIEHVSEPPIGGSFLSTGKETPKGVRANPDFYNLGRTIMSICQDVRALRAGSENPFLESKLGMEVDHLAACLDGHTGSWVIGLPTKPIAPEHFQKALFGQYGVANVGMYTNKQWLRLPSGSVTAARALVRKSTTEIFEPVVDMRIRTDADTPAEVYDTESFNVRSLPSDGRWFRFSLIGMEMYLPEERSA